MVDLVAYGDRAHMIFVYVLKSTVTKFRYVGITKDLSTRLKRHNSQNNRSTKAYAPFVLVLSEAYPNYLEARQREQFLKSGAGRNFLDTLLDSKK